MCNLFEPQQCGLVLEGGGLRTNYTAGVLDAFLDAGIHFPYVIGVSGGACMGISYVALQRGRNIQMLYKYHNDPRYISLRNLFTTRSVVGKDFLFNQIPNKYIVFDYQTFAASSKRFVMVCTNLSTGEAEYLEKRPEMDTSEFFTILEASSSMPYTSNVVKYNGNKYLDGAISDPIPLKRAEDEGYKQNVIVLTNPAGYRKKEDIHPPDLFFYPWRRKLRHSLKIRVKNYNEKLDYAEAQEKAGHAIIIRPSIDLKVARLERNKDKLIRLYDLGISDTKEMLKRFGL